MNRARHATLSLLLALALPTSASAQAPPTTSYDTFEAMRLPDAPAHPSTTMALGHTLLESASWMEQHEAPRRAAALYRSAATLLPELHDMLRLHAATLLLSAPQSPADPALLPLLSTPIPQLATTQLELFIATSPDAIPPAPLVEAALSEQREPACALLLGSWRERVEKPKEKAEIALLTPLAMQLHARCQEDEETRSFVDALGIYELPAATRLARADLLIEHVHFNATLNELSRFDYASLTADERCQALFIQAQATYRIRKRRDEATPLYTRIASSCTAPSQELTRRRSLYAMGKRAFETDKLDDAKRAFTTLLDDYPTRSHADDAILYLARIARTRGDQKEERALMQRALEELPSGDMLHEIVWEVAEPLVYDQKDKEFIAFLDSITLPKRDDQYFSQGRLEYLRARALERLKEPEAARALLTETWKKYPFSFYGYLCRLRAERIGATRESLLLARDASEDASWLFSSDWLETPAARLARNGLFQWAARHETLRVQGLDSPTDLDRWRLAWLHHKAGNFPYSHNVARRQIDGPPWAAPLAGRTARWVIAWPAPFLTLTQQAVTLEQAQHEDGVTLHTAFPLAITREESSFIPDIVSYAGALGLMQLMHATAKDHDSDLETQPVTVAQLKTPEVNIRVGVDHLFTLAARTNNHPVLMAASYNAGSGAVRKWLKSPRSRDIALFVEDIPTLQARDYSKRVVGSYLAYQWLLGEDDFDPRAGDDAE